MFDGEVTKIFHTSELQRRRGIEDNSKRFFFISQQKHML